MLFLIPEVLTKNKKKRKAGNTKDRGGKHLWFFFLFRDKCHLPIKQPGFAKKLVYICEYWKVGLMGNVLYLFHFLDITADSQQAQYLTKILINNSQVLFSFLR